MQFGNVLHLLAEDQINGTPLLGFPTVPPIKYNFFGKFAQATTEAQKLNVVRELYRLLVPNSVSASYLRPKGGETTFPTQVLHVHKAMMLFSTGYAADPTNPANPVNLLSYYQYNVTKYAKFDASLGDINCPAGTAAIDGSGPIPSQAFMADKLFVSSPVDSETEWDVCNTKAIYTPPLPLYAPFGLGYRRCAGELFTYQLTLMMLERFNGLEFYVGTPPANQPIIGVAPERVVANKYYARVKE